MVSFIWSQLSSDLSAESVKELAAQEVGGTARVYQESGRFIDHFPW